MIFRSRATRTILWLGFAGLPAALSAQNAPRVAPVAPDPLELAAGHIQTSDAAAQKATAVQLLTRARRAYALRNLSYSWDLKVHFTVDSQGQTNYDGDWDMEDIFSPGQGLHWTATSTTGYSVSGIFGASVNYVEATGGAIPLRLQEARALLYNPLPSVAYASGGAIRTAAATYRGAPVVCVLLSHSSRGANPPDQRGWNETEDCIDPQSGLLQMHSDAPGRYAVYDYANSVRLDGHSLPRTVTVMEGGRLVSKISVTSLQAIAPADPSLFVPSDGMKAAGPALAMGPSRKISRIQAPGSLTTAATLRPVCVFGIVTPAGRLAEAHSLQPSDPNSDAAVRDAQAIDFSPSIHAGAPPEQHFVFVIEEFVQQ